MKHFQNIDEVENIVSFFEHSRCLLIELCDQMKKGVILKIIYLFT